MRQPVDPQAEQRDRLAVPFGLAQGEREDGVQERGVPGHGRGMSLGGAGPAVLIGLVAALPGPFGMPSQVFQGARGHGAGRRQSSATFPAAVPIDASPGVKRRSRP